MARLKIKKTLNKEVVMIRNGDDIWIVSTHGDGGICIELCHRDGGPEEATQANDILIEAAGEDVKLVAQSLYLSRAEVGYGEGFTEAPVAHP